MLSPQLNRMTYQRYCWGIRSFFTSLDFVRGSLFPNGHVILQTSMFIVARISYHLPILQSGKTNLGNILGIILHGCVAQIKTVPWPLFYGNMFRSWSLFSQKRYSASFRVEPSTSTDSLLICAAGWCSRISCTIHRKGTPKAWQPLTVSGQPTIHSCFVATRSWPLFWKCVATL